MTKITTEAKRPIIGAIAVAAAVLALALALAGTEPATNFDPLSPPADISTWGRR